MRARLQQLSQRKFVRDTAILQSAKFVVLGFSILSSLVVWRLLGPDLYGIWGLGQSLFIVLSLVNLSGVAMSTTTRLPIAVGANDQPEITRLMGLHLQFTLLANGLIILFLLFLGTWITTQLYPDASVADRVSGIAVGVAVASIADGFYNLLLLTFASRRLMGWYAVMQMVNQVVLTSLNIIFVGLLRQPEGLLLARICYSYITFFIALWAYQHLKHRDDVTFPAISNVVRMMFKVSPIPYLGFGVTNAMDKNASSLFQHLPLQLVGIWGGTTAVGYLNLALNGLAQLSVFTAAIFENMQAIIPRAVGRKDYVSLQRNFTRVLMLLTLGSAVFYSVFALLAPLVLPIVLGDHWRPAIPTLSVLAIFGAFTTVGGLFGLLYRALDLLRPALIVKVVTWVIVFIPFWLVVQPEAPVYWGENFIEPQVIANAMNLHAQSVSVAGAWLINLLYVVSIVLTACITLPVLKRRAREHQQQEL